MNCGGRYLLKNPWRERREQHLIQKAVAISGRILMDHVDAVVV
jgi:hypothetical protein